MNKDLKIDHSSLQEVWAWNQVSNIGVKGGLLFIELDQIYTYQIVCNGRVKVYYNCEPYDNQDKPQTRLMTHAEVFKAVSNGAVMRFVYEDGAPSHITNVWQTGGRIDRNEICYNYTGTESDVWEKMEVGV